MGDENIAKNLQGLKGWLILVGLGIVIQPVRLLIVFLPMYSNVFTNGNWEMLTTAGNPAYHPFWATFISIELIVNIGIFIAMIYLAYLFFTKKEKFPRFFIGLAVFSLVFILLDALGAKIVMPNDPIFDVDTVKELTRSLLQVIIWVPYMLRSKRVKATFIK